VFEALVCVTDLWRRRHLRYDVQVQYDDKGEDPALITTRGFSEGETILEVPALHFNNKEKVAAFLRTIEGSELIDTLRVCSKGVLQSMHSGIDAASPVDSAASASAATSVYSVAVGLARYIQPNKGIGKKGVNAKLVMHVGGGPNDNFLTLVASSKYRNGIAAKKAVTLDYGFAWSVGASAGEGGNQKRDSVLGKIFAAILKGGEAVPIVDPVPPQAQVTDADPPEGSGGASWVVSSITHPHAAKLVVAGGQLRLEPEAYGTKKRVNLNTPLALISSITPSVSQASASGTVQWEFASTAKTMVFEGLDFCTRSRIKRSEFIEETEASSVRNHDPTFNKSKAPQTLTSHGGSWMGADARTIELLTLVHDSPWLGTAWHVKKNKEDQIVPCGIVIINVKQLSLEACGEHFDLGKA
jgi:hypothetical protein